MIAMASLTIVKFINLEKLNLINTTKPIEHHDDQGYGNGFQLDDDDEDDDE